MARKQPRSARVWSRRRFASAAAGTVLGSAALAGCTAEPVDEDDDPTDTEDDSGVAYDGPGVTPEGTPWADLPELSGSLTIYSGRREAQIDPILTAIEEEYDDLTVSIRYDDNEAHLTTLLEEGQGSPADILYTQDSGTLGALANEGRTVPLTDDVLETVPSNWRDPEGTWTGVSGRTRCVAYNTDVWDADELPTDIYAYPDDERFVDEMGWRVDSGSFLAFVRAMMIVDGEERTREFVDGMQDAGITNYEGGSTTPEAIAAGEVSVGFINQYYAGRLLADRPDAPLNVTFTDDIGSLFNVSGAAVLDSADDPDLARDFVRHLLGTEGQQFFVDTNREYAVIPGIDYVGELPTLSELDSPDFDLNRLADIEPAVDLLREVGIR